MTECIIEPDPAALLIGQECEWTRDDLEHTPLGRVDWEKGRLEATNKADRIRPYNVSFGTRNEWVRYIRIKKPEPIHHPYCAKVINSRHDCTCDDLAENISPDELADLEQIIPPEKVWDRLCKSQTDTALVPMTREDVKRLRAMEIDPYSYMRSLADRIEAHLPKPKPPRPEIAIDDPVRVRDETYELWEDAHFAGWDKDGDPTAWANGRTSHTSAPDDVYSYKIIKTQDGTIWKGDTN